MKRIFRIILLNTFILAVGLLFIEIVWKVLYSDDIRYTVNVLADTHYKYDVSSLYPTNKKIITYNRDKNGFRGTYDEIKNIDLIVMGGSTADQRYIDDNDEWSQVLADQLNKNGVKITIVNAGVDGQSTFGHIKNFDLWFSKLKALQPKYVLFYVGVNDFYKDSGVSYDALSSDLSFKGFVRASFSFYLKRLIEGLVMTKKYQVGHGESPDMQTIKPTKFPLLEKNEYSKIMSLRLKEYSDRLNILIEKTEGIGAKPIFVTQRKMSYWNDKNGEVMGVSQNMDYGSIKYNGVDMYYMNKLLNKITMKTCNSTKNTICIDLESELVFDQEDFYDFAHNTPSGALKIGEYLAKSLEGIISL